TGEELFTITGHEHPISAAAFSPDGRRLAIGSLDGITKVWDANKGRELLSLKGHTASILAVAFSADGRQIVTGSSDNTARGWTTASDEEVTTWREEGRLAQDQLAKLARERERQRGGRASDGMAITHWLVLSPI